MYYKFSITGRGTIGDRYESQQIYPTEAAAYLSAYFFCLRADLDNEPNPALIVDCTSGYILSINLPAFELLAIDAVGFQMFDFVDQAAYEQIVQQLQQTGASHYTTLLHNADGYTIEGRVNARIYPYYCSSHCSRWAIFRLNFNQ